MDLVKEKKDEFIIIEKKSKWSKYIKMYNLVAKAPEMTLYSTRTSHISYNSLYCMFLKFEVFT